MSEDPIRKYSGAIAELEQAMARVQRVQSIIGEVHSALHKPFEFMVSNVDVGFPPEVAMARGIPSLNADNWPSAKQIAEALATLHQKRKQVSSIWASLSENDKKIVNPPPFEIS